MKTYLPPRFPADIFYDPKEEPLHLSQRVGALYGQKPSGEKFVVPEIWLQGDWLAKAGFEPGDHIGIEVRQGKLMILKLEI